MQFITGNKRHQTFFSRLEDQVADDNPVSLIDAFIDKPDLTKMGITNTVHKSEGRPPYAPAMLLKLYLWGYLNKIRSSRKHITPLKSMFRLYVQFLSDAGLLDKTTIGIYGLFYFFYLKNIKLHKCPQY